jgi:outer membrane protein TolC
LNYNQKIFNLLKRRRTFGIAHPEDVQKMEYEIIASQESIDLLENDFQNSGRKISKLSGLAENIIIVPQRPKISSNSVFQSNADQLIRSSRTYQILQDKERSLVLAKDIALRNLLPELDFFLGYRALGQNINLQNSEHYIYGGISAGMNFGQQREKALAGRQKLELKKMELLRRKNILDLNLYLWELKNRLFIRQKQLALTGKKLQLAESIMRAENKNYTQGRSTLNDLLLAKKNQENTRFDLIKISLNYQSTLLEWLMATDQLVKKNDSGIVLPILTP